MADKYNFRRASRDKEYKEALFGKYGLKGRERVKARIGYAKYKAQESAKSYGVGFGKASEKIKSRIQANRSRRIARLNAKYKGKGKRPTVASVYKSIKPKGKYRDPFLDFLGYR